MGTTDGLEIRCGEIFITHRRFNFHCSLCRNKYEDFPSLLAHISQEHFTDIEWAKDKVQNNEVVHLQGYKIEWDEQSEEQNFYIKSEVDEDANYVFNREFSLVETNNFNEQQISQSTSQYYDTEVECITELKPKIKKGKKFQYSCNICERSFKTIFHLNAHISHKHSDERNFRCDQCYLAFKSNANLRAHQRRHESSRNFECFFCLQKFYTKDELVTHELVHTCETPYICTQCGKGFTRSGLANHMKRYDTDRRYKCEHCEKTFYTAQKRKIHIGIHTGEHKHNCSVCHAAFTRRKALLEHMKIHICDTCESSKTMLTK